MSDWVKDFVVCSDLGLGQTEVKILDYKSSNSNKNYKMFIRVKKKKNCS